MKPVHLLPFLILPSLTAQGTTVSVVASGPIAALTSAAGGTTSFQGVPSGRPIGASPTNLFLFTSQAPTGASLSATTICYPTQPINEGIGVNFFERANARGAAGDQCGTSASAQQAGASFGPHGILCTFANTPGRVGKIVVSFRQSAASTGSTGVSVDIGNDNTLELQSAVGVYREFPFTFGTSGTVDVRVANDCRAAGDGTSASFYSWTEVWVGFLPDLAATCTFTNYGQGCGPQVAGADIVIGANRLITLVGTGCFPNSPVVVANGTASLALPLPGGCTLLSNMVTISIVNADGAGITSQAWSVPVTATGRSFHQFLPVMLQGNALVLAASNGVQIDCAR